MNDVLRHKLKNNLHRIKMSIKWVVFSIISGIAVGTVGTLFYFSMSFVTKLRGDYPWILYFLPIGGVLIVGAYRLMHDENDTGTNLIIHLYGGSVGREGAALQLGGSIGNGIGLEHLWQLLFFLWKL